VQAARTKWERRHEALLEAAYIVISRAGWAGTRMSDVARDAGVSTATAYNHFPTKHALVGAVFAKLLEPLLTTPAGEPPPLKAHLLMLTRTFRENRALTVAFIGAVQEAAVERDGRPIEPDDSGDPRVMVPLPIGIANIIAAGQQAGRYRATPIAFETAASLTNLLLLRVLNRPQETAAQSVAMVLELFSGPLGPP
jgi:AcrR family transcriptional regulator